MKFKFDTLRIVIFLAVIGGGAVLSINAIFSNRAAITRTFTGKNVLDGTASKAIDQIILAGIPRSAWVNGIIDGALYRLSGNAGPEVRAGCEGWLFLAEEMREVPNGERFSAERIRLAQGIASDLRARGIQLVLVGVPDKFEMAREYRCGLRAATQARIRADMSKQIAAIPGVVAIDLAREWPLPGFWRTDTHWDRSGSRFAAEKTAAAVNAIVGRGGQQVRLVSQATLHERPGDLMRLAGLEVTAAWFGPQPDLERDETAAVARTGGLLDEPAPASVVLAGSSYSLNSGFVDYLQVALSREVAQASRPASGFAGALLELLDQHRALLKEAKVVVWEWPMRSLTQPLTDAERAYVARKGK